MATSGGRYSGIFMVRNVLASKNSKFGTKMIVRGCFLMSEGQFKEYSLGYPSTTDFSKF